MPSGKVIQYLRFEHSNDSVCIVCIKGGKILVQREYSYPLNATLYHFPGGAIEPGESAKVAARRELREESGVQAALLTSLGFFYRNNRREKGRMHVFQADADRDDLETEPDTEEFITSEWLPIPRFECKIAEGEITNFSMLAAWALYQNRNV